jgi:hypothetical protein
MSPSRAYLAKKLSRPLPTKDGGILRTIAEARANMAALPPERELSQHWQRAYRLLLERADVADVSRQLELALFLDHKLDLAARRHPDERSRRRRWTRSSTCSTLPPIYDPCSCSRPRRLLGSSNGTFQMSWAYSPMVRSEENHAIRAMLSMLARVQSNVDSHSLSTLLCVAQ